MSQLSVPTSMYKYHVYSGLHTTISHLMFHIHFSNLYLQTAAHLDFDLFQGIFCSFHLRLRKSLILN